MKKVIRLTESDLHRIIKESVKRILKEDLGGASTTFGLNSHAGSLEDPTGQQKNHIDKNAFPVQRRKMYSPKGDAKGDVTKQESNVDMTPALKTKDGKGGSTSIPKHRV